MSPGSLRPSLAKQNFELAAVMLASYRTVAWTGPSDFSPAIATATATDV